MLSPALQGNARIPMKPVVIEVKIGGGGKDAFSQNVGRRFNGETPEDILPIDRREGKEGARKVRSWMRIPEDLIQDPVHLRLATAPSLPPRLPPPPGDTPFRFDNFMGLPIPPDVPRSVVLNFREGEEIFLSPSCPSLFPFVRDPDNYAARENDTRMRRLKE